MRTQTFALAAVLALGAGVAAAERVEQRRPADPRGRVHVENPAGRVTITGWDRAEVSVTGEVGHQAEGLLFTNRQGVTRIGVEVDGPPHGVHSRLVIHVPRGSAVDVEGFNTSIDVRGVSGSVNAETVNGAIAVEGSAGPIEVETVNGEVTVEAAGGPVRASSVNGAVSVRGASRQVEASTVNGRLWVTAAAVERARLETVSGELRFTGGLHPRGRLEAETVSGSVELELSGNLDAQFAVSTFSGDVENELGPPARRTSRHTSQQELRFTVGSGTGHVSVSTLSGHVLLRKR